MSYLRPPTPVALPAQEVGDGLEAAPAVSRQPLGIGPRRDKPPGRAGQAVRRAASNTRVELSPAQRVADHAIKQCIHSCITKLRPFMGMSDDEVANVEKTMHNELAVVKNPDIAAIKRKFMKEAADILKIIEPLHQKVLSEKLGLKATAMQAMDAADSAAKHIIDRDLGILIQQLIQFHRDICLLIEDEQNTSGSLCSIQ
jgi:hypothetical protein